MMKEYDVLGDMGQRIISRRKQLGMSQEELAEKADISVQMLSTAERGAKGMRPINLLKISEALGVSADYLLKGKYILTDDALLYKKVGELSNNDRETLEIIIDAYLKNCENK